MNPQAQKTSALTELLGRMESLLSPRVGIGGELTPMPRHAGEPLVYLYNVETALLGPQGMRPSRPIAGGAGFSPEEAAVSALGELVEGYCAAYVVPDHIVRGSYRELRQHHEMLEPERFALFSERQYETPGFPYPRFSEDAPCSWVWGYSLVRRKPLLVPASRVYMPYTLKADEPDVGPTISTGLATGSSLEGAIVSGLQECMERDAFTLFWMNSLPVRRIQLRNASRSTRAGQLFHQHLEAPGYEYRAYDITSDLGVPTTYSMLACPSARGPLYIVGGATRLDGGQATLKALMETVQTRPYVLWLMERDPHWRPAADFSNVVDFPFSCRLYTVAEELRPHLLSVEERVTSEVSLEELPRWESRDAATDLAELVQRFERRGYEAVVVELTTPDIAALGLRVVRVVTPELQQLHADHRYPFLGGKRLYDVPVRLGYRSEPADETQLNPYPHPYP
ncbi:MAG TPA: YcaO-like family protein [Archangium sp.]|uniref:YcaO-like family protein n=1 Tax=Archangium sp. TaxID=1872627 RepID=UPI002E366DC4|nr:YcaO-like family protein [Archangium sp.]HEX5751297.1 YcaO-like family protein [Archangium sp.]